MGRYVVSAALRYAPSGSASAPRRRFRAFALRLPFYGHLARDGRERIRLLDGLSARTAWWTAWTPNPAAASKDNGNSGAAGRTSKPSDGLEPSTLLTMEVLRR